MQATSRRADDSEFDPLDNWQAPKPLFARMKRAVAVPIAAGAVVLVCSIIISIAVVWLAPHSSVEATQLEMGSNTANQSLSTGDGAPPENAHDGVVIHETANEHGAATDTGADSGEVVVHVVGEVVSPGVVKLRSGARVEGALAAAGGATDRAVLSGVNLARQLVDGEQIVIPDAELAESIAKGEEPPLADGSQTGASTVGGAPLNLNTADAASLETLPGIGPALAERILDYRATVGAFASVEQLRDVSGIGVKKFEDLRDHVTVP